MKVALSVGVQLMVRSDKASSGVIFTLDPDTGFDKVATYIRCLGAWRKCGAGKRKHRRISGL